MTLEEEKKLVAEKDLVIEKLGILRPFNEYYGWNPQSERKWWDEIWEKMDGSIMLDYIEILRQNGGTIINLHTAKPEVCWKALIKTLEDK